MPILINPLEDNIETRIVKSSATLFGLLFQAAPASAKSVKVLKTYSTQSQSYYANLDQFYVNKSLSKKNDFYSHNYNGNLGWPFRKFSTNKSEQVLKPNGKTSIYRFVKFSSTKPGVWIWRGHLTKEPQQLFKKSISNHNHFGLKHVNTIRKELFKLRVALIQTKVNDHEKDPGATIDWFKASGSAYEIDFETLTDSITKKKTYYWENNTPVAVKFN